MSPRPPRSPWSTDKALRQAVAALGLALALHSAARAAEPTPETLKLASEVPIADVHLHLNNRLSPAELLARMDRNNVRWAGAAGAQWPMPSDARAAYVAVLGPRYIASLGQPELAFIYFKDGGANATQDAAHPRFRALLERAEGEFKAGSLKGFGELHANNLASGARNWRRKIRADAPSFREMYSLAAKHGGFLQIHMETENDSVAQFEALLAIEPRANVIMAHCGVSAAPATIRVLMEKFPNVYCDLSFRSPPMLKDTQRRVFDANWADPAWLALIETFPERFMVGTDYNEDFDGTIAAYRKGLLPRLAPATLRKVAFENAQRVLRLE
jgi:predicted TIM-barrel fold metal-dependent hydrolase